ncbi:hypothetical protein FACS189479_05450 [Spirochaetia bacterium]|nr:hypothetical protein FACS189479_05450 [Spirochaetia bacterium]
MNELVKSRIKSRLVNNPFHEGNIERVFLAAVIAGERIPEGIDASCFRVGKNRVIFKALVELEKLEIGSSKKDALSVFLNESGMLAAAGGEMYIKEVIDKGAEFFGKHPAIGLKVYARELILQNLRRVTNG